MANGICVFAENYNGNLEPVVAELVRAAHCIKETTGEKIQAAVLAEDCKALVAQLEQLGFDEIYAVETDRNCLFQDDAVSQAMAEMLKRIDPWIPGRTGPFSSSRTNLLLGKTYLSPS